MCLCVVSGMYVFLCGVYVVCVFGVCGVRVHVVCMCVRGCKFDVYMCLCGVCMVYVFLCGMCVVCMCVCCVCGVCVCGMYLERRLE